MAHYGTYQEATEPLGSAARGLFQTYTNIFPRAVKAWMDSFRYSAAVFARVVLNTTWFTEGLSYQARNCANNCHDEYGLLLGKAMQLGESPLIFRRKDAPPPSSGSRNIPSKYQQIGGELLAGCLPAAYLVYTSTLKIGTTVTSKNVLWPSA